MKNLQLLDQKSLVDSYLAREKRLLSSFSFVSIFAWGDFFDFELSIIDEALCIFAQHPTGTFLYLPPLNTDLSASTIEKAFKKMAQGKALKAVNRIENIPENLLSVFKAAEYNQYTKPAEYVYRKEDLVALSGNAYKSQRHDCNHFVTHRPGYSFMPYSDADRQACLRLYEQWASARAAVHSDDIYCSMLEENRLVHERLLQFWKELGLLVRVLKIEGRLVGYTLGFPLNESTFCVYGEIADLKIQGIAAFLFRSFCADKALASFEKINTMDDFAMPQVAFSKQAYHPSEMAISYTISMKAVHLI